LTPNQSIFQCHHRAPVFAASVAWLDNGKEDMTQTGFDPRVSPENVCFYVTGIGTTGLIHTSTTAVVPKEAIVAAINQLEPN
jgi:hypothetical protein